MTEENNEVPVEEIAATAEVVTTEEVVVENTSEDAAKASEEDALVETTQVSQEAFNKLYFEKMQAERDLEALRNQSQAPAQPDTQAPATTVEKAPVLEDFDYDETAYTAALVDYKVKEQLNTAMNTQQNQYAAQQQQHFEQKIANDFNDKAIQYASTNPDYEKVVNEHGNQVQYPASVQAAILQSEVGPQLDYMLLKDPSLIVKLSGMNDYQALMEMGRLESVAKTTAPAAPAVSTAPAPIEDVVTGGNAASHDTRYDENASMDDYYKATMAAQAAKNGQ